MKRTGSPESRKIHAKESFKNAAECIGDIYPGKRLFAVTRGQWSMIDAILHCLDQVGLARVTVWTWTIAEYEVQVFERLMLDDRITGALLVIDYSARNKNGRILHRWRNRFGDSSVKSTVNHAKIATIETESGIKLLLRGSMNLNFNPRFEQFDMSEGCDGFELVREIENELPVLPERASSTEIYSAAKVGQAFDTQALDMFRNIKVWAK